MDSKLSKEHLRKIFSRNSQATRLGALSISAAIKIFSDEYLRGIMNVHIKGGSTGEINLKPTVLAYLLRLLCQTVTDRAIECTLSIDDDFTIFTTYPGINDLDSTAYVVKVARLAGFSVDRDGDILIFKTKIRPQVILPIFATTDDDFTDILIAVFKM